MTSQSFHFEAPNRRQLWQDLSLTMSQAAALTGVSERQIQHWMDKGYIPSGEHGARKIDGNGLDTIVLIKQARQAGIPLRQAVPMAHAYLAREAAESLGSDTARWAVRDLRDRLAAARGSIEAVESLLATVDSADGRVGDGSFPALAADTV